MQLLGCQPFPVFRITRVAFGRFLRRVPNRLAVAEDGSHPERGMSAGMMVYPRDSIRLKNYFRVFVLGLVAARNSKGGPVATTRTFVRGFCNCMFRSLPWAAMALEDGAIAAQSACCTRSGPVCPQILDAFKAGRP